MKYILTLIAASVLITGCHKGDSSDTTKKTAQNSKKQAQTAKASKMSQE